MSKKKSVKKRTFNYEIRLRYALRNKKNRISKGFFFTNFSFLRRIELIDKRFKQLYNFDDYFEILFSIGNLFSVKKKKLSQFTDSFTNR